MNLLSQSLLSSVIALTAITSTLANANAADKAQSPIKTKAMLKKEAKAHIKSITPEELKKAMKAGEKILLIDVRTEGEFLAGHLNKAMWIPRGKLECSLLKITTDPKVKIVLYCRTGTRSCMATKSLQDMGYKNVFDLTGGFAAWTDEGYSIFNRHGELKVIDFENENKKANEEDKK